MIEIGELAPEFELTSAENERVKLSDFRGQRVVLFFYPKAATPGCTTQACGFRDNYAVITEHNATVVGISPDEPPALAKWKSEEHFPYPLLSDSDHAVAEAYGAWGERKMYGRSYMGIIRSHFLIDEEGKLADIQIKVSPEKSIELALKALGG
ncbi:MAG: thioredoxin-dependent thiol peroxidase [Chloroflexi bacterium]|nr:thioredoxin-dependent thiol peroxidase [Chloroflexota bacterium]MBK6712870.1 thioredoxin-dependent thiol peroxidase [Chloroflexota bacterium]MBK7177525.1 thioredoxin-dependent thiol peroxidase [Chloroflexota bacterium]MBK7918786.1 thioredoxin-dependent thiol peroxidase [Chloroflexota bacterium]MBK8931862.1 thioredoxin-dependent thiol peroxidase [Chloroflexota bacterium]